MIILYESNNFFLKSKGNNKRNGREKTKLYKGQRDKEKSLNPYLERLMMANDDRGSEGRDDHSLNEETNRLE